MKDYFGYHGKICIVTGASSGIGRATTETLVDLGAEVYALDVQDCPVPGIRQFLRVNLSSRDSIDEAFGNLPKQIDKFFGIAGVSGISTDFLTTFTINFIANKYIVDTYVQNRLPKTEDRRRRISRLGGRMQMGKPRRRVQRNRRSRRLGSNNRGAEGEGRRNGTAQPGLPAVQAGDQLLHENKSQTVRRTSKQDQLRLPPLHHHAAGKRRFGQGQRYVCSGDNWGRSAGWPRRRNRPKPSFS